MYRRTQTGYWGWLIWPIAAVQLWLAWYFRDQLWLSLMMMAIAAMVATIALSFQSLTIQDEGDYLGICFGPIPLAYKRIDYDEIHRVERGKTKWIDGWGIHWVPGRGWTYNIRGFDCVKLTLGERTVRIGTDDPEGLLEMLQQKVGERNEHQSSF